LAFLTIKKWFRFNCVITPDVGVNNSHLNNIFSACINWIFLKNIYINLGGNLLCLHLWCNGDSGPWLHCIHFGYAVGAVIAPLTIAPYLSNPSLTVENNATFSSHLKFNGDSSGKVTQIGSFFLVLGLFVATISLGFLYYGIKHKSNCVLSDTKKSRTELKDKNILSLERNLKFMVLLMGLFFFIYVGVECCYGQYSTLFAVSSDLKGSKLKGTQISATFWFSFATMRFLAIFAAIYLPPSVVMNFSLTLSFFSALLLLIYGNQSYPILQVKRKMDSFPLGLLRK